MPHSAPATSGTLKYFFVFLDEIAVHPQNCWTLIASGGFLPALTLASSIHILTPPSKMCGLKWERSSKVYTAKLLFWSTFTLNWPIARIPACQLPNMPKLGLPPVSKPMKQGHVKLPITFLFLIFKQPEGPRLLVSSVSLSLCVSVKCRYVFMALHYWGFDGFQGPSISFVHLWDWICMLPLLGWLLVQVCGAVICWNSSSRAVAMGVMLGVRKGKLYEVEMFM